MHIREMSNDPYRNVVFSGNETSEEEENNPPVPPVVSTTRPENVRYSEGTVLGDLKGLHRGKFTVSHEIIISVIAHTLREAAMRDYRVEVKIPKTKQEKHEAKKKTEAEELGTNIAGKGAWKLKKLHARAYAKKKPKTSPTKLTSRPSIHYIIVKFTKNGDMVYTFQIFHNGTIIVTTKKSLEGARAFFREHIGNIPGVFGQPVARVSKRASPPRNYSTYLKKNQPPEKTVTGQNLRLEAKRRGMTEDNLNQPVWNGNVLVGTKASALKQEMIRSNNKYRPFNEYVRPNNSGKLKPYRLYKNSRQTQPSIKSLHSAGGKALEAYQKAGLNMPNELKNYFEIKEKKTKNTGMRKEVAPPKKDPTRAGNLTTGYYSAYDSRGKLHWFKIPDVVTQQSRNAMVKRFRGEPVPQQVKNFFEPSNQAKKHRETREKTKAKLDQDLKNNLNNKLKNRLGKSPTNTQSKEMFEYYKFMKNTVKNKASTTGNLVNAFVENMRKRNLFKDEMGRSPTREEMNNYVINLSFANLKKKLSTLKPLVAKPVAHVPRVSPLRSKKTPSGVPFALTGTSEVIPNVPTRRVFPGRHFNEPIFQDRPIRNTRGMGWGELKQINALKKEVQKALNYNKLPRTYQNMISTQLNTIVQQYSNKFGTVNFKQIVAAVIDSLKKMIDARREIRERVLKELGYDEMSSLERSIVDRTIEIHIAHYMLLGTFTTAQIVNQVVKTLGNSTKPQRDIRKQIMNRLKYNSMANTQKKKTLDAVNKHMLQFTNILPAKNLVNAVVAAMSPKKSLPLNRLTRIAPKTQKNFKTLENYFTYLSKYANNVQRQAKRTRNEFNSNKNYFNYVESVAKKARKN